MALELLREPVLATEVIAELDACYTKATEKKKKNAKGAAEEEPNWLEVVTDILISLLSQDQHLLRSLVVSVWSLLANHITVAALQQVLDVKPLHLVTYQKELPIISQQLLCSSTEYFEILY